MAEAKGIAFDEAYTIDPTIVILFGYRKNIQESEPCLP
jgi:hypothetical protein